MLRNLGKSVQGHVLDVNRKHFNRALSNFDSNLYTKWNPNKNKGNGLWEIRMKPLRSITIYEGEFQGAKLFRVEPVEHPVINHILDVPFLNYSVISRLREMDAWENKTMIEDGDALAEKFRNQERARNKEELRYQIRHHKKYFETLQDEMRSGRNPIGLLTGRYRHG